VQNPTENIAAHLTHSKCGHAGIVDDEVKKPKVWCMMAAKHISHIGEVRNM